MLSANLFPTASFRLVALYLTLFIASIGVLAALLVFQLRAAMEGEAQTEITNEMNLLLFEYHEDGLEELLEETEERIEKNNIQQRLIYMVQNPAGRVIFDPVAPVSRPFGWRRNIGGGDIHFLFTELDNGYVLGIGKELSALADFERAIGKALIWTVGAALLIGLAGGTILSRRTLARVEAINRTAQAIGVGRLSQRIELQHTGDEFDDLSQTLNRMFDRIEHLVANVRQVSTGIAHDLRTPLARLRHRLENLRDQQPLDAQDAINGSLAELDRILETFAALLRLSELEAGTLRSGFQAVDMVALVQQMVEAYQPLGEDLGTRFQTGHLDAATIPGDSHLLQQLIANLFENALQHAGRDRIVEVIIRRDPDRVLLLIADNGPGIPERERARMLKPFQRLDPSQSPDGSGLGLALAAAIAQLHGAELRLSDNHPGLRCELDFTTQSDSR